jgi:hypothetical protein
MLHFVARWAARHNFFRSFFLVVSAEYLHLIDAKRSGFCRLSHREEQFA